MRLFALDATRGFGTRVAQALGVPLAPHEERTFEDSEHKIRPLVDPAGHDCVVVQSLHGEPGLQRRRQAGAPVDVHCRFARPWCAPRHRGCSVCRLCAQGPPDAAVRSGVDPVIAQLFEAVQCDALVTLEVHNVAAFDNAFRMRAINLSPNSLFTAAAAPLAKDLPVAVASPDIGGIKRAQLWREALEREWNRPVGQAFVDKRRAAGVVSGGDIVTGEVRDATVLIIDDLIATFGTIDRAAQALRRAGAARVFAFAAHGLFVSPAADVVTRSGVERVFVTDTVPLFRLDGSAARERIEVLPAGELFASALRAGVP